jgi:hypothetical protein
VKKFGATGKVDKANCVNKETDGSKLTKISIRHYDRVGVLAHVFKIFAEYEWNV